MQRPIIPLDAFELGEVIGRCSAGAVWRARHRKPNGEAAALAIKLLTGAHARSDGGAAAFRREVRPVAALDHPQIVRIYEHGRVGSPSPFPEAEDIPSGSPYLAILRRAQRSLAQTQAPVASAMVSTFLLPCLAALGHWDQFVAELSAAQEGLERSGRTELDLARMPDKAAVLATQAGRRPEAEGALILARAQWIAQGNPAEVRRIDAQLTAL